MFAYTSSVNYEILKKITLGFIIVYLACDLFKIHRPNYKTKWRTGYVISPSIFTKKKHVTKILATDIYNYFKGSYPEAKKIYIVFRYYTGTEVFTYFQMRFVFFIIFFCLVHK